MEITAQYMEFLKANYSSIATRLESLMQENPTGNTPEEIAKARAKIDEEIKSLANNSECVNKYQIWEKVPPILRDRYGGRVPPEIMEAAERDEIYVLREMEYHPEKKNVDEVREEVEQKYGGISLPEVIREASAAAQTAFVAAVVAGYSVESSTKLATYRQQSDELSAKLQNPNLTDAEKSELNKQMYEIHKNVHAAIKNDWGGPKPNQPEKMLIHALAKFNGGHMDKDELVALMADLQPHLKERQAELLNYMQRHNVQLKIGHFKDHTRDLLAHFVLKELPDISRHEVMERSFRKKNNSKGLSEEQQAIAVAKNMSATRDNVLPQQAGLSMQEKRANMPSALNRGNEREA